MQTKLFGYRVIIRSTTDNPRWFGRAGALVAYTLRSAVSKYGESLVSKLAKRIKNFPINPRDY